MYNEMEKHFQIMCEKAKYMVMMALLTFLAACDKGVDADKHLFRM